jgi:3',5'-cyclic AMP phosphodiesterase CpdA
LLTANEGGYKLAHISDLHFTSTMRWPPQDENAVWAARLLALKADLIEQQPQAIMVTGDIADNPTWELTEGDLQQAWRNALDFLEATGLEIFGDRQSLEERLFVIPGNHDAKILGNIRREELIKVSKRWWFRLARWPLKCAMGWTLSKHGLRQFHGDLAPIFSNRMDELLQERPSDLQLFHQFFKTFIRSRPLQGLGLFVFCVDSNFEGDTFANFAQGVIPPAEAQRLRSTARAWRREFSTEYDKGYKLVLVHHHPMPMPRAEGSGALTERDEFHLLRNAGSFLQICGEEGIDMVLHGHKHAHGWSAVSFPVDYHPFEPDHLIAVIGAGSIQIPWRNSCCFNVIHRLPTGEWQLEVRERDDEQMAITPFRFKERAILVGRDRHRRRAFHANLCPIRVGRADVVAQIDEAGDLVARYYMNEVSPTTQSELREYPVIFWNESKRISFEAIEFEDTDDRPNVVRGRISIDPPATREHPQDVSYGIRGVGLYTFSREYCRWHKRSNQERFGMSVLKSYDELVIDLTFPEWFPPIEPKVQVVQILASGEHDPQESIEELLRTGRAAIDQAETVACRNGLRVWPENYRLAFRVLQPLPDRVYEVVWQLPEDEYVDLPNENDFAKPNPLLGSRVRNSIDLLSRRAIQLDDVPTDRRLVNAFLGRCGQRLLTDFEIPGAVRVDLAVNDSGVIKVVAAVQGTDSLQWMGSHLRPSCTMGEFLRGKAFLQREILHFSPESPQSGKDPDRVPEERLVRRQLSIPLVYPPALPFWPRVGVLTFSWDADMWSREVRTASDSVLHPGNLETIFAWIHEELQRLALEMEIGFPDFNVDATVST